MTTTITTQELASKLDDANVVIVDIRPIAAYNGWRLGGEARGGHIRGAVACPQVWTGLLSAEELRTLLANKGVVPEKTVVVYGYDEGTADKAARQLTGLGYRDLLVYGEGFGQWADDRERPVERLARYERLVYPEWIHDLIDGERPETYPGKSYVICHVTFGVPEEYEHGHIPGAIHLDTNWLEDDRDWNRRPAEALHGAITALGIRHDTMVVVYGRDSNPSMSQEHPGRRAGQIAAKRAAAILMYAGVEDVRFLDGGFDAWLAAGYESESGRRDPVPVEAFGREIPARPDFFVDIEEARELLSDPEGVLVSIRSWEEFTGDTSGYHYIGPSGRIPGAVWGNGGTDAYHMQHYRNVDNTMREYDEIVANWRAADITPEKRVAFYCGTGWRASETFLYAYLLGWPRVAVYDGGWFEWSADPANPVEHGIPEAIENVPV